MGFTNDDILTLARAGFTAQQIGALNSVSATPEKAPEQPKVEQPSMPPKMETQEDMLSKILGAIQSNAINQTSQPERQTTDDILAEIINPPVKE